MFLILEAGLLERRGSTKYSTGKIEWRLETCALSMTVIIASRRRPSRSKTLRM